MPLEGPSTSMRELHTDGRAFSEIYPVRCYEVGPDSRASIITVANLLQARSSVNAALLLIPMHSGSLITGSEVMPLVTLGWLDRAGSVPARECVRPRRHSAWTEPLHIALTP